MPTVLVLFDSRDDDADRLAVLAVDGAKSVRFTEVDVRTVGDEALAKRKRLDSSDGVAQYDGVIVIGSDRDVPPGIDALLGELERSGSGEFVDCVFAAIPAGGSAINRLSKLGGIVVGIRADSANDDATARKIGERVAKVAEWVRHALSHEHGHSHHAHSHQHSH